MSLHPGLGHHEGPARLVRAGASTAPIYGLLLIVFIIYMPKGILGTAWSGGGGGRRDRALHGMAQGFARLGRKARRAAGNRPLAAPILDPTELRLLRTEGLLPMKVRKLRFSKVAIDDGIGDDAGDQAGQEIADALVVLAEPEGQHR